MTRQEIIAGISKKNREDSANSDAYDNKVSTSRFIFYLKALVILGFIVVACYTLYTYRFKKSVVNINDSSLYTPKYK